MERKTAIIIGAGPAGLTAAFELLRQTDIKPVILEMSADIGGISKTVQHNGNRIDIGPHRFFSKSERIMQWWKAIFPLQSHPAKDDILLGRDIWFLPEPGGCDPEKTDRVMLMRKRLTRIFFLRKLFEYPLALNLETLLKLGLFRTLKICASYSYSRVKPIRPEKSLEDFFINRFGRELYLTFFKDYTEKVWGIPCKSISPEWGAQRVKSLSISRLILHAIKRPFSKNSAIDQKNVETSLIHQFMFPKLGAGQFWEAVADIIKEKGGELRLNHQVIGIEKDSGKISAVLVKNRVSGQTYKITGDYFFSSMPVRELIQCFKDGAPTDVRKVAQGLQYRDSIVVGLLLKRLKLKNNTKTKTVNNIIPDNWLYIQERDAKVGRLQIFNNFSPYMVKDLNNVSIGLEYFCSENDEMSSRPDSELIKFAVEEMIRLDFIDKDGVIDSCLIRMPKAYPVYFGTYHEFDTVRNFTDGFENLFLIGRNGMHRYNNMDHSMLSAMTAVENIVNGVRDKANIWLVNTEKDYSEEKQS